MNTKSLWYIIPLASALMVSCSVAPQSNKSSVLTFHGAGEATELGVVSVRQGESRGSVEWHLAADQAGEDRVVDQLEKQFGMKRIRSDEGLEAILRAKFQGVRGKDAARALWKRYRSATFSALECDNATIIFFDSGDRAVEAWPVLGDVM